MEEGDAHIWQTGHLGPDSSPVKRSLLPVLIMVETVDEWEMLRVAMNSDVS